ncbi:MAG: restriction endonuclease subunit S [Candidatus Edwardsbacteria bacterium]|nr:restriction endonuclease subunit S [Candidatus Edwardsbacteria bacterium]
MSRPATQHKRAAYPAYKPSGVAWLGDVPEHWEIHRLKHVASVQFSSVDKHTLEGEEPVRLCNYVDVYYNDFIAAGIEFMSASATQSEIARFQLCRGDVLVTKDSESWDDIAVPSYVAEKLEGVLCGYHLAHIRPHPRKLLGEYLFRAFRSRGINDQFRVAANGITRFGLGKYWLDNGLFPIPPLDEQRSIAAFLDRETARIDALIEKKRRQIELLQEKRSALINHAVTKGLDPNAKMKDSGIEWLGDVPEHWDFRRLKYTASINDEALPETTDPDYEFVYVDIGSVNAAKGIVATETYRFEDAPSRARRIVRDGDTIVSTVRTYLRAIAPIRNPDDNLIVSTGFAVVRPRKLDSGYLSYALRSPFFVETVESRSTGVSYPAINAPEVGNIGVTIPSLDEQRAIAAFLDRETARIDALIEKVEASIETLREHRTALISAAVTGKIDVRKEVPDAR